MLTLKLISEETERVVKGLEKKHFEGAREAVEKALAIDKRRREAQRELDSTKQQAKQMAARIGALMKQGKREEAEQAKLEVSQLKTRDKELQEAMAQAEKELNAFLCTIPNIPHESVPLGKDENDNVVVYEAGSRRKFDFKPKEHWEIGEDLDIIDFESGAKVAGSGFYCLKGDGARLERALINYFLDMHQDQGYTELFPPVVVNKNAVIGTGQYPNLKDDMYYLERDDMFLNPTAEVPVTNLLQDEILEKSQLPIYYTAYLPSFRREVGKHADTKGIIRVHEFNKVEMVNFVLPENSYARLEELRKNAEDIINGLGLPYRVLLLCTGDMSFSCSKCYDLELYAPGKDAWLEASSCSNFTDFQARRARIKYRPEPHLKSEFVHTLNGSGLALPRTMVAILENYQNKDGTVTVPDVLRPYMRGQEIIGRR